MGSGVIKCLNKDLLNNKLSKDIYEPRSDKRDLLVLKSNLRYLQKIPSCVNISLIFEKMVFTDRKYIWHWVDHDFQHDVFNILEYVLASINIVIIHLFTTRMLQSNISGYFCDQQCTVE